jgi:hypothetical protein
MHSSCLQRPFVPVAPEIPLLPINVKEIGLALSWLLHVAHHRAYLFALIICSLYRSKYTLTGIRIIDQRVTLRSMNELEVLSTGLPEDGLFGHDGV